MTQEELPSLRNISLRLEWLSDLLSCCNTFYEMFLRVSDDILTDPYRAALYVMLEQGESVASELVKISGQIYLHSDPEPKTETFRFLNPIITNKKENENE